MRIICVCRSGGEYTEYHVNRLKDQCTEHAPGTEFLCLDDATLKHGWPGWFSKMELFRLHGPCLYFDLDTVIIGDIAPLLQQAREADFTIMRDVNARERADRVQSSVMAWRGDMSWLYRRFAADPERHMAENSTPEHWGDQGFIGRHIAGHAIWQDALPGALVSWKKHCNGGVPDGARVIVFHGKPRPWDVEGQWL